MSKIYYHNLKDAVESSLERFHFITPYTTQMDIPLLAFTHTDEDPTEEVKQFIQAVIPDDERNRHVFLALKTFNNIVQSNSLWTLKEMEKHVTQVLNK